MFNVMVPVRLGARPEHEVQKALSKAIQNLHTRKTKCKQFTQKKAGKTLAKDD